MGRYRYFVSGRFKLNIYGDRIAGWKRSFQRLVKQVINMRYLR